jgi:hypothetical protein
MSEISVSVVGSTTINPTVGNGDTVNVTIAEVGERGPTGATGPANSLSIGTVAEGTTASATITGTAPTQTLNLVLPKGDTGSTGSTGSAGTTGATGATGPAGPANALTIGTVTSGTAGATITGTSPNQVLNLVLQKGDTGSTGPQGPAGTVPLADEIPQPLGTASAGSALTAARADHVHAASSISYSSLSGIPTSFTPAAHTHVVADVTGLQAALDAKQASGTYATLVGGTVPSSQLPSFVDDVIDVGGTLPSTGDVGKIYVVSTGASTNKIYRWSGSAFIEISPSPGSTDSVTEGSTNLYFTDARAQSALASSLSGKAATSHTHTPSQVTDFAAEAAKYGPVTSVNGQTGAVTLSTGSTYTLPAATVSTLGGVIVGSGLSVSSGTLSASVTSVASRTGAVTLSISDIAGLQAALDDLSARIGSGGGGSTPTITISSQPSAQTASGGAATFSVTASVSSGTLTYQWQRQALGTGSYANVSGATSATLSLTGLTNAANNADNYRVVVSATGATAVTSNSAALTVAAPAALLSITRTNEGGVSSFSAGGTASNPTFTRTTGSNPQISSIDGISRYYWTAGGTATVTLSFGFNEDEGNYVAAAIRKKPAGGSFTAVHSFDNTTFSKSFTVSVVAGDVIDIQSTSGDGNTFNESVSAA